MWYPLNKIPWWKSYSVSVPKILVLTLFIFDVNILLQGGLIARGLFALPNFDADLVHTIITQATPHQNAVINLDQEINAFYTKVNKVRTQFWCGSNPHYNNPSYLASKCCHQLDQEINAFYTKVNKVKTQFWCGSNPHYNNPGYTTSKCCHQLDQEINEFYTKVNKVKTQFWCGSNPHYNNPGYPTSKCYHQFGSGDQCILYQS